MLGLKSYHFGKRGQRRENSSRRLSMCEGPEVHSNRVGSKNLEMFQQQGSVDSKWQHGMDGNMKRQGAITERKGTA